MSKLPINMTVRAQSNYSDDMKMQKEKETLEALKESLARSDVMTHNMLGILNTFENRLGRLEETIIPIYQETGNLQRRHENIGKTLESLGHVISYYHASEEVNPVLSEGPSSGLDKYLECMEKLQKATEYFTENHPESPEMSQVTTQYEAGKDALEREFRQLLTRSTKPMSPDALLEFLAVEEESTVLEAQPLQQMTEKTHDDLAHIANWLVNSGYHTDYMQVYAAIRSNNIVKNIDNLREHFKAVGKDSGGTPFASPMGKGKPVSKDAAVSQKALKRIEKMRKGSFSLRKQMAKLEATGLVKGAGKGDGEEEHLQIDIDYYINAVSALVKLANSELKLMQGIVPDKHARTIFDKLVQAPLDVVIKEGERLCSYVKRLVICAHIKKAVLRHDYTAVLAIFPVLKHLRAVRPELDVTLEGCQMITRNKLVGLISSLDQTGEKALEGFRESIRNTSEKHVHMPQDGTVHELTSNTIIFLEQLLEFRDTAGSMLLAPDPTWLPNLQHLDRPKLKLAEYTTKVLSALGLNLSSKSETYTEPTLRSVFMLNNYNYILHSLNRTGLLELVNSWNNEVSQFYETQVLEQKRFYSQRSGLLELVRLKNEDIERVYEGQIARYRQQYDKDCWSRVLHHIIDSIDGPAISAEKIRDRDRQNIKDKFSGFNKEMEEITRFQKTLAVPDPGLRANLRKDNKDFILPYYRAFLKKYGQVNFTKNVEKYLKYTEADVAKCIDQFFDASS